MANVGYATLQVIPSLKGVHATIGRELGGAAGQAGAAAGQDFGRSMSSSLDSAMRSTMRGVYSALEGGALAAGGLVGASLIKGWSRLTTIQDATSALTISLGDSAAAGVLLGDVLDVVRGTPFNLDQFAAAAQRMAGMGIEAEKIPGYLEAIGEASATQGGRANEFAERLSTVFGQIAAQGQLTLADVWRISDTGVNALTILGNAFGVTTDEMKDMISSGAVPAGIALDALSDGILNGSDGVNGATVALSGTMEALRDNMSGAVAGISSAMARLGESLLAPFSPAITAGANAFAEILDDIGTRATGFFEGLDASALEPVLDIIAQAPGVVNELLDSLGGIAPVAGAAGGALGAMGLQALNGILGPFEKIVPRFGIVGAGIAGMVLAVPEAREALMSLGRDAMPIVSETLTALQPVIQSVSDTLGEVVPVAVEAAGTALLAFAQAGGDVVTALGPVVVALLDIASPVIVAGLEALAAVLDSQVGRILALAIAWGKLRSVVMASAVWTSVTAGVTTAAGALGALRVSLAAMDFRGLANASTSVGLLKNSLGGLASTLASSGAVQAVAVAGIAYAFFEVATAADKSERAASRMFDSLEASGDITSVEGLRDLIAGVRDEIEASETSLENYTGVWGRLRSVGEGLTPLKNGLEDATATIEVGEERISSYEEAIARLQGAADITGMSVSELGTAMADAGIDVFASAEAWGEFVDGLTAVESATANASGPAASYAEAIAALGDEAATTEEQVSALNDAIDAIFNPTLDVWDATTQYREALAALTKGLEENGHTWDANTEAGRKNRDLFSEAVRSAMAISQAVTTQTGDVTKGRESMLLYAEGIRALAREAGIGEQDIAALSDELGILPDDLKILLGIEDTATPTVQQAAQTFDDLRASFAEPLNFGWDPAVFEGFSSAEAAFSGATQNMDLARASSDQLAASLAATAGTPVEITMDGSQFYPTAAQVEQWVDWYGASTPEATALLETGGAQLGFTSLTQWSAFYSSLSPETIAHLNTLPADQRFAALMNEVNWYRLTNPSTTATANTAAAEAQLNNVARARTATINVRVASAGIAGYGSVDAAENALGGQRSRSVGRFDAGAFGGGAGGGTTVIENRVFLDGKEMAVHQYPHTVRLARGDRRAAS